MRDREWVQDRRVASSESAGATALMAEVRAALGDDALPDVPLRIAGRTGLDSPLPVGGLGLGSVAAQLLAARALTGDRSAPLDLDAVHVGMAMRSERWVRLDGSPVGLGFAPLSRFWRTADGWLRLHGNYPHHRAAALRVLGEDVASAATRWNAEDLETAVVEAGGAAAAVRTAETWRRQPQGAAVDGLPMLSLQQVTDGPPRSTELRGLRVLDLTRVIAGPVATRTLASHGADVLRIDGPLLPEDPDALLDTGSGKRHVTVDLRSSAGRRTVEDLLGTADVLVQGYRPGALDAFGLEPGTLAQRHPHLVVVRLSAWGLAGPWRHRRGFDSLVQAATGIAVVCGSAAEPGVLPAQALDHATGHLAAAVVLVALARRQALGGGWHGELSLAQTAHWLLAAPRSVPEAGEAQDAGAAPPDPRSYLIDLPSTRGTVTVVAPPGSPPWSSAAETAPSARPVWSAR
jgi:crotonobetainyl-CoA:carnitine CoA-transferase CaiB-like acyl-CoA transferase